jgi:hypothetical protein
MPQTRRDSFEDRRSTAEKARQAALERFRRLPRPDDPAVQARLQEQKAVAEAREARRAEREAERARLAAEAAAEAARLKAEEEARQAALAAEAAAQRAREEEAAREAAREAMAEQERKALSDMDAKQRALAVLAEQKALRDARYAARKARKK